MSKTAYMRGLQNFISDLREAQNKEQEQRRVEKELAKIRERFHDDRSLSGYDRRKYVWKLLYIYMLGYNVEFGHKQAADLIPQPKYKDKQVGYMACSLLLRENDEFLRLTMNAVRLDLTSRNEAFETLALSFIGSVGGTEMAEALTQDVIKLLSSGGARPLVKKRAALALLRLMRKTPADQQVVTADTFSPVINALLDERDLGLLLASTTLLQGVCARYGAAGYEGSQTRLIKILERLTMQREKEVAPEYLYYGIPSPWLQCKCLRVLQFFPPPETAAERSTLTTILQGVIDSVGAGDAAKNANPNKANALYAILFEAISLALQYDTDRALLTTCVTVLGNFLTAKEPNVRYLALETLSRLALVPEILEAIRHHQSTVVASLRDPDTSIRKRSMDLLFTMCDTSCAEELVREMLAYLVVADFSIREELVLKVAILAEKFAPNVQWYVDVVLELLEKAGDYVSEDVWHRVVQLVTNNPAMQQYAARNVATVLKRGARHESLICTAAYLLGEFGRLIATDVPASEQFKLLHEPFAAASQSTKGLLLTAFIKIYLIDPSNTKLRTEVLGLFERFQKFMDADLQQRATEYLRLSANPQAAAQHYFLPMPKWEERESTLLRRLHQTEGVNPDALPSQPAPVHANAGSGGGASPAAAAPTAPLQGTESGAPAAPTPTPAPAPAIDLLGSDSPRVAPVANGTAAAAPAAKPAPTNAVDLLSDLLGDALVAPAPAPPAANPSAFPPVAAGPTGASLPPVAGPTGGYMQPPPMAGPTGGYMQPPPVAGPTGGYSQPLPVAGPTGGYMQPPPAAGPTGGYMQPPPAAGPTGGYMQPPPVAGPTGGYMQPPPTAGPTGGYMQPPPVAGPTGGYPQQGYPGAAPPGLPYSQSMAPQYGAPGAQQPPAGLPYSQSMMPQYNTGTPTPAPYATQFTGAVPVGGPYAGYTGQPTGGYPAQGLPTGNMPPAEAVRPTGSIEQWFHNLQTKDRGILYEDSYLQVGLQARYNRATGQIVLFLGNKSKDTALQAVQVLLTPPPGLQATAGPAPAVLPPGQQVQVPIQVAAIAPFSGAPGLSLSYQLPSGSVRQELRLPVVPHKFMIPEPTISKEVFFEQWKAHGAPPAKCQEMVADRTAPLASPSVVAAMKAVNLGVEHGYLDPSPNNEAGAAFFVCAQPGAPEQAVLVMARVEGNPQNMAQFRVTVSSPAPQLSAHVKDLLVSAIRSAV